MTAFLFSPLGRYAAIGLIALALTSGAYWKGDSNGASRIQAKWDTAVQAAIGKAEKARSDAESVVEREPAGGVPNDKYDRDTRPM